MSKEKFLLPLFLLAIIAPFNNCTSVNTPADHVDQAASAANANLMVQLADYGAVAFDPNNGELVLHGNCNANSIQQNVVWWSIEAGGKRVWDSYLAGGEQKLGHCAPDKSFSVLVTSPCKSGTGCMLSNTAGGAPLPLTIRAHITGYGEQTNKVESSSNALTLNR